MITEEVRRMFQGPFNEERVWMCDFPVATDGEIDHTKAVVEEYADKISATFHCLCFIECLNEKSRPATRPEVILICVVSRSADKETFDTAMSGIVHDMMDEIVR